MLGTDLSAFSAADAVRGLSAFPGIYLIIVVAVPVVIPALGVEAGKQIGNPDVHGAAGGAVAAAGTGNGILRPEDCPDLVNGLPFLLRQRLKVLHIAEVVLHLRKVAHAAEHHKNALKGGGVANGIAGGGAALQRSEDICRGLWQIGQRTALHRLHDQNRLSEFPADLVDVPAFHAGIVIVQIVELNLDGLNIRLLCQDPLQYRRLVMEGNGQMTELALRLELPGDVVYVHDKISKSRGPL